MARRKACQGDGLKDVLQHRSRKRDSHQAARVGQTKDQYSNDKGVVEVGALRSADDASLTGDLSVLEYQNGGPDCKRESIRIR